MERILTKHKIKIIILIFLILTVLNISARAGEKGKTILINGELREMSSGDFWDLEEGYRLSIVIEGNDIVFTVSKNGQEMKRESMKIGYMSTFYYYSKGAQIISIPTIIRLENNKVLLRLYQRSDGSSDASTTPTQTPKLTFTQTPTPTSGLSKPANSTSAPVQTTKPRITTSKPTTMPTPTTPLIIPKPPPMEKSYRLLALILIILLLFQYLIKFRK